MPMQVESIAAIDIGSNAIRLLINNVEEFEERKSIKKNAYIRVPVRLGEDVFQSGQISRAKIDHLVETMRAFVHLMHVFNVSRYRVCATSAMREAANGQDVMQEVKNSTGIIIDIISGTKEAELVFEAGRFGEVLDNSYNYIHVDVGGGSTEVSLYCGQQQKASYSFPLGTLRYLAKQVTAEAEEDFKNTLATMRRKFPGPLKIIASGGNINKTLKLFNKKDGDSLDYETLRAFHADLSQLSFEERLRQYKMNSYRADVIVPALHIFLAIGRICQVQEYIIPKVGLVDGIIRQLHSGALSSNHPPV